MPTEVNNIITLTLSGGNSDVISGGSNISTSDNNTVNNILPTNFYLTNGPQQIAGFNPMLPCDYMDCRDNNCGGYLSPVFGDPNQKTASYSNDLSTFFVTWSFPVSFVIQKQNQPFFGAKNSLGNWNNIATVTDNTYGTYYPVGSVPNNPTWTGFTVNWGAVVGAFGTGIYRISTQGCTPNVGSGTQPTVTVTIPSYTGHFITGSLKITGANPINITINYGGTYGAGYLTYLCNLINATGLYTASSGVGTIIITGINYNLSPHNVASYSVNNNSNSFSAYGYAGFPQVLSATSNVVGIDVPSINLSGTNYNQGGYWNGTYWTCPTSGNYTFTGQIVWRGLTSSTSNPPVNVVCKVWILVNGVRTGSPQTFTATSTLAQYSNYSLSLNVTATQQISLEVEVINTVTLFVDVLNYAEILGTTLQSIYNTKPTVTTWIFTNGTAPTMNCICASASYPYLLRVWDCNQARKTVKIEANLTGSIGDPYNDGNIFVFNGFVMYDSIRFYGFAGNMEPVMEEVILEFGSSTSYDLGQIEKERGKLVPNNKLMSDQVPFWVYRGVLQYAFLPTGLGFLLSDYNINNADYFIQHKVQKYKGNIKVKYYNRSGFDSGSNWRNQLVAFDCTLEDGIQSGIAISVNI